MILLPVVWVTFILRLPILRPLAAKFRTALIMIISRRRLLSFRLSHLGLLLVLFVVVVVRVFSLGVPGRLVRMPLQLRVGDVLLVGAAVCLVLMRRRRMMAIRLLVRILPLVHWAPFCAAKPDSTWFSLGS
jgi:hypothetical protein